MCVIYVHVVYACVCAGMNACAHTQRTKWGAGCFTLGQSLLEPWLVFSPTRRGWHPVSLSEPHFQPLLSATPGLQVHARPQSAC